MHEGHSRPPESGAEAAPRTVLVTYLPEAGVPRPVRVDGREVLESRSPVVWFTFPGTHHDIGRFHTPDGELTGYYANILTPVEIRPGRAGEVERWRTTDLFLDLFLTPAGTIHVLDRDELQEALRRGWVTPAQGRAAEQEVARLIEKARIGTWPPPVVNEWPLERARRAAAQPPRRPPR